MPLVVVKGWMTGMDHPVTKMRVWMPNPAQEVNHRLRSCCTGQIGECVL
jgi:hypothetical protein